MPRDLNAATLAGIDTQVTAPGYLVALTGTYGDVLRFSTRGTLTHGGYSWGGGGRVVRQSPTDWTLILPNTDNAASAIVLGDDIDQATVDLWSYVANASPPQAVLLFSGYVNQVIRVTTQQIELGLVTVTLGRSWLPDVILAPPLLRHLPLPGTAISWKGTTYFLESGT